MYSQKDWIEMMKLNVDAIVENKDSILKAIRFWYIR